MAEHEFELIAGEKIRHVKVFINDITYRNYHFHGAFEFLLVLEGTGVVNLAGGSVPLSPGSLVLVNPNEAHEIDARGEHLIVLIFQVSRHFCGECLPELSGTRFLTHDLTESPAAGALKGLLLEGAALYLREPAYYTYSFLAQTATLFYRLLVAVPHEHLTDHDRDALRRRVQRMNRILDYIEENYTRPIRLRDIAETEGLTPTYVSHFFSEQFGVTFQEYLNNLRFERAMGWIHNTALTISEAALCSGFSDPKYLNKMMQQKMGCSVKAYRQGIIHTPQRTPRLQNAQVLERYLSTEEALQKLSGGISC